MQAKLKNELVILGLLAGCPGEGRYGYQLNQEIKARQMDWWARVSMPSIYSALNRLEAEGLIRVEKERVGKMPERNVYYITDTGRARLAVLAGEALTSDCVHEDPFNLGLAFLFSMPQEEAVAAIQSRLDETVEQLNGLRSTHKQLRDQVPFNWRLLIEGGIDHLKAEASRLRRVMAEVKNTENWDEMHLAKAAGSHREEKNES